MKKLFRTLFAAFLLLSFAACTTANSNSGGSDSSGGGSGSNPGASEETYAENDWLNADVPSLYETYKEYFEHLGIAVEYGNFGTNWGTKKELYYEYTQKGLAKHTSSISLGNELKPQFIFSWWGGKPSGTTTFTALDGNSYAVPTTASLGGLSRLDDILTICKKNGLKMRGHVLLWHSQTDEAFFRKDYDPEGILVDTATMNARLEWYIKTILSHVAEWEDKNNSGNHIIWAWDVINEVTSDNSKSNADTSSTDSDWLRTDGSNWYSIYKSSDFIVNAFRYANKYAPSDVKLVYNDYGGLSGTSTSYKHKSQLRVVDLILSHKNDSSLPTRLDAMGLQSHYSIKNSAAAYQTEIQDFIAKGIDVQITELDIGTWDNYDDATDTVGVSGKQYDSLAEAYAAFFTMFIDNRKTSEKNGVDSVTIWGINDESTWLNSDDQRVWLGNCDQYPLLFKIVSESGHTFCCSDSDYYVTKPAFYSVIKAATDYEN